MAREKYIVENITDKQIDFIDSMNEICTEKFNLDYPRTKYEASEYISRNIEEFKLFTMDPWVLEKGYF